MPSRSLVGWAIAALVMLPVACGGNGGGSTASQSTPTASPSAAPVVVTASASVAGATKTILVDSKGMTLYYYTPDKGGKITCTGQCLAAWPPLLLTQGTTVPHAKDITGTFTTMANPEGKGNQILYNNWPLYYWVKDQKPGDTTGQGVGGKWFVATPDLAAGA